MRYKEIIAEDARTVEHNGITLRVTKPTSYELKVEALDDWGNKVLGYVEFDIGDNKELDPQDLRVDDRFQGQGIAKTMYDYVKSLGYKIVRSWDQTDAGSGFWDKHRGADVRVWENTAAGINKMFNNLGDPVYANLQRVALLAMQGRQQEAQGRLNSVIKDASPQVQKKIIDAVNVIKPVTINGRVADSSTLDKSKAHQDWILNTFIPWVQSLLGQQGVAEAFDQPYNSKWEKSDYGDVDANTKLPDGTYLNIMFNQEYDGEGEEVTQVEFHRNNSQEVTGEGDAQRIFATVLDAIQKYIKKYKPQTLIFSASKEVDPGQNSESRAKLYNRLVQRYASSWGYQSQHSDDGDAVRYQLTRTVSEGVPQPGPSSGAPKQFGSDAKIVTKQMTAKEIIASVPGVPYYNNVVDDYDSKDYSWGVTNKVIEYATYLKDHPESLSKLPPVLVLNGKFEDGAHRLSAIWLLQQRMDPKNPLWANAKLNVQFIKTGVAENFHDGRNPQDKGDSKRHGVPTKASISTLRKVAKQGGRKGQLAHWMANMKSGRAKAKNEI